MPTEPKTVSGLFSKSNLLWILAGFLLGHVLDVFVGKAKLFGGAAVVPLGKGVSYEVALGMDDILLIAIFALVAIFMKGKFRLVGIGAVISIFVDKGLEFTLGRSEYIAGGMI